MGGYLLSAVEIVSADDSPFPLSVCTIDDDGFPTSTCWALSGPGIFNFKPGTIVFTAPANTRLAANTTYTVYLYRRVNLTQTFTSSNDEDGTPSAGWSIANEHDFERIIRGGLEIQYVWETVSSDSLRIAIKGITTSGEPTISGQPRVPAVLTADTTGIMDIDGVNESSYTYQWTRVGANGSSNPTDIGTESTYTLTGADAGKKIKVKVGFKDDNENAYEMTSAAFPATGTVLAEASCAAPVYTTGTTKIWQATLTVGAADCSECGKYGFFVPGNGEPGNGELTDNTFKLAATNMGSVPLSIYAIDEIAVSSIDNALTFSMGGERLSPATERTLALHVCDETLDFKKATLDGGIYKFTGTGLDWSDQVTRKLYLSRDETAPSFSSATLTGTSLALTFSEDLDEASGGTPANSAFVVKVTPSGGTQADATLSGSPTISGKTVTLTLSSEPVTSSTVTVAYTRPAIGGKLRDRGENEVATFASRDVTIINSTPTAAYTTVIMEEDTAHPFGVADFGFADTNANDVLASVTIETLPLAGTLTLDGVKVEAGDSVSREEIEASKLVFSPTADENGEGYASFSFKVSDGVDDSASAYTMTFNVTPANDAATGKPALSGTARVGHTLSASTEALADVDGLAKAGDGTAGHAYGYQWMRVDADGTSNESAIEGANSSTYRLASADDGKKVRVRVSFVDDGEGEESVTSDPYPPSGTIRAPPRLTLALSKASVVEGADRKATLTLSLDGAVYASAQTFTLSVEGTPTAQENEDWAFASKSVTVPAGATEASATVAIVDDVRLENAETVAFMVSLDGVRSAPATLAISDDDRARLVVEAPEQVTEGEAIALKLRLVPALVRRGQSVADDACIVDFAVDAVLTVSGDIEVALPAGAAPERSHAFAASAFDECTREIAVSVATKAPDGTYRAPRTLGFALAPAQGSDARIRAGPAVEVTVRDDTIPPGPLVTAVAVTPEPAGATEGNDGPAFMLSEIQALGTGNRAHGRGQRVTFTLTFDRPVTVTGKPELVVGLFHGERRAVYKRGSGTGTLVFEWTVQTGDVDPDGLEVKKLVVPAGATLKDMTAHARPFVAESFPSTAPKTHFPRHKVFGGLHGIELVAGGTAREGEAYAIGLKRTGNFGEYTFALVTVTDSAFPDIAAGATVAIDGPMEDGPGARVVEFDPAREKVAEMRIARRTVTPPGDGARPAERTLTITLEVTDVELEHGQLLLYEARGPVTMAVPVLDRGVAAARAGAVTAVAGLPTVTEPGDDGVYAQGERIVAEVAFDGSVTVDVSQGSPALGLALGGVRRGAAYAGGSGTAVLTFAYSVAEDDDGAGEARAIANGIVLNGATVRGEDGTHAVLAFGEAPGVASVRILAPVSGSGSGDGAWDPGEALEVVFGFEEPVTVETARGTPSVGVLLGAATKQAAYARGSGTDSLVFAYTLVKADARATSVLVSPDALALNGGAIRSTAGLDAGIGHVGAARAGGGVRNAPPLLSVADAQAPEGATLAFVVTLAPAASGEVTVEWATADGTARAGSDYTAASGTLTFAAGATRMSVEVAAADDDAEEAPETLTLTLSNPSGARLGDGEATGTVTEPGRAPLTGSFSSVPPEHDGTNAFVLTLAFSEAPEGLSYKTVRDTLFTVTGATVDNARRLSPPSNERFELTLTPDGNGAVTLALAALPACGEAGSVCTADGRALAGPLTVTVSATLTTAFTAAFANVPREHDGTNGFEVDFNLSAEPAYVSYVTVRDSLFAVTGGSIANASRQVRNKNRAWKLKVIPSGNEAVTLTVKETTACDTAPGICTSDGRTLAGGATATIAGPAQFSVADAEVEEAEGATLDFVVTLSRARSSETSVGYATSDDTATAGSDYTAASGTLTFASGETGKTVPVPVLDDAHDDDGETLTFTLSNPSGAVIADGEATGTINNTDAMPKAWLARFGRTVAGQVLDAVESRLEAPRTEGVEASLAGQRLGGAGPSDEALERREAQERMTALADWVRGETSEDEGTQGFGTRTVSERELLLGSSFALTGGSAETGFGALWGRATVSGFDGRDGELTVDGEVTSAMLGADWTGGRATAGLALAHSRGEGSYRSPGGDGEAESTLTGLYPYGRYALSERVSLWGVAGYGAGTLTLRPEEATRIETGMALAMGALGLRGVVVEAPAEGGMELSVKTDALAVRTTSDAASGTGGNLASAQADVTRLRLGLQATWHGVAAGGGTLTPTMEVGVRHDGGDAETGFGADIGAGLAWVDPASGLSADIRARGLIAHEADGFSERGFSGTLSWDPEPSTVLGPSLTLTQTVGAASSGGAEALLGRGTMEGLAPDDGGDELERRHLEAKLGYGFALFGGRYSGTPELGLGLSGTDREYVLGWRLAEARRAGLVFGLDVEGARRERVAGGSEPEHRVGLGLGWRLEGVGAERFELRFEAARLDGANDAAGHRLGVRMSARW